MSFILFISTSISRFEPASGYVMTNVFRNSPIRSGGRDHRCLNGPAVAATGSDFSAAPRIDCCVTWALLKSSDREWSDCRYVSSIRGALKTTASNRVALTIFHANSFLSRSCCTIRNPHSRNTIATTTSQISPLISHRTMHAIPPTAPQTMPQPADNMNSDSEHEM